MILTCIPYSVEKNLGKSYNEAFKLIGKEDWLILMDTDAMFLLPDQLTHIARYIELFPDAGCLVCYANRSFPSGVQIYSKELMENDSVKFWIEIARERYAHLYQVTEVKQNISGNLMAVSKKTWNEFKFTEELNCLGVDTKFSSDLLNARKKILRMEGILIWHTYRIENGVHDKSHLTNKTVYA